MSTRNPAKWTKIRDTVREAQDILSRIAYHDYAETIREQARQLDEDGREIAFLLGQRTSVVKDMSPPQTLGELCLGWADSVILGGQVFADRKWSPPDAHFVESDLRGDTRLFHFRDIQDLRRTMYRREPVKYPSTNHIPHITTKFSTNPTNNIN